MDSYPHGYLAPPITHENHYEAWMPVDTAQAVSNYRRVCVNVVRMATLWLAVCACIAWSHQPSHQTRTLKPSSTKVTVTPWNNRAVNLRWATPQRSAAIIRHGAKGGQRNPSGTFTVRITGKRYDTYKTLDDAVAVRAKYAVAKNG
jgi:hypothetical protein